MEKDRIMAESPKSLISSDRVEGTAVFSREGTQIGAVRRLMIDKTSGRVVYVSLSIGSVDLGADTYTIPWGRLRYDAGFGGYRTDITESELREAPTFARTSESGDESPLTEAQEEELHAHFQIPPDWRAI